MPPSHALSRLLQEEHHAIRRLAKVLEGMAGALSQGHPVAPTDARKALEAATGFSDGCHHEKEEHALFPALLDERPEAASALLADLESGHARGRELVGEMEHAADAACGGDARAAAAFHRAADAYASHVSDLLGREDQELLPLADSLSGPRRRALQQEFEMVEQAHPGHGAHEGTFRTIEGLARKYARFAARPMGLAGPASA